MKIASVGTEDVKNFLVDTFVPATDASQLPSSGPKNYMASHQLKYDMACYATLAKFLSDKEAVGRAAARLDGLLWGLVLDLDRQSWLGVGDLFLEALRRVGAAYGFNRVYCYALYKQVSPEAFRWVVSQKSLFHDAFTRPHGEYTHAVQWLLMAVRFDQVLPVAELYKRSVAYVAKKGVTFTAQGEKTEPVYLWNFLVDCFKGEENFSENIDCQTFRCPQIVTLELVQLRPENEVARFIAWLGRFGTKKGDPAPKGARWEGRRTVQYTDSEMLEALRKGRWQGTRFEEVYRVMPSKFRGEVD